MTYKYTHFIPENIAPKGAVSIEVYNKENQLVTTIPLGRMTPPLTEPIYSFGLISDLHLTASTEPNYASTKKVQKALRYFQDAECDFVIACGDLTNTGFFTIINNEEKNPDAYVYTEEHFAKYQSLCQEITIPVYAICGNHENYGDGYHGHKLSEYMTALTQYTGINSWFQTIDHKGDSFVFLSQPDPGHIYSDDDMAAITTFLDDNLNKRIYIIIYTYIEYVFIILKCIFTKNWLFYLHF